MARTPSTRIPSRTWTGLMQFTLTQGLWPVAILAVKPVSHPSTCELELSTTDRESHCRYRHGKCVLDTEFLSGKTDLWKGREGTQTASTHSSDISAGLRLSNMSNYITVLLQMEDFAPLCSCTCSTELLDPSLFNSDYETGPTGPLLCTKFTSVMSYFENVKWFRNIIPFS